MKPRNILLPVHIRGGIKHRSAGFPMVYRIFSGDCETVGGQPLTLQLTDNADDADLFWVDQKTILPTFLNWMKPRLLRHRVNVCFFHALAFDLTALLYDHLAKIDASSVILELHGTKWEILSGKVYYAKIRYKDGTVLHLIDSFRFFTTSLAKIGKDLGTKNQKGEKPAGLGKARYTPADAGFIAYAKCDAMLGYEVGEAIIAMHQEFDVALSLSAPQFAMRVFTKYYMRAKEQIALPGGSICNGALLSYHGGKNGFYVKPGLYRNVTELDISSAYPHAMKSLPQFVRGHFRTTTAYEPGFAGIYRVTGSLRECRYAIFQTHDGKALHGGRVEKLWVTSYELEEALRAREFTMESCVGKIWIPDPSYDRSPLGDYVDTFYAKKEGCSKGDPRYLTYKLLSNSLYGKFIQNVEVEENGRVSCESVIEPDGRKTKVPKKFKAGGLFSPVIASLITGFVRAYLHRLEHKYSSIHSSTDSIKTLAVVDRAALPRGLGGLNVEVSGDCILLRNKLYLHYDGPLRGVNRTAQQPKKYALHGFWGTVDDLLAIVAGRQTHYHVEHLYRMKEAARQNKVPLRSYRQEREVSIDWQAYGEHGGLEVSDAAREDGAQNLQEAFWIPVEDFGRVKDRRRSAKGGGAARRSVLKTPETVVRRILCGGGIKITADAVGEFRRYGLKEGYGSIARLLRGKNHPGYSRAMDWSQWTDTFIREGFLQSSATIDDLFELILKNKFTGSFDMDDDLAIAGERWLEKHARPVLGG